MLSFAKSCNAGKKFISLIIFFLLAINIYAQQASSYFPHQVGWQWEFKVTPLDSLNNEIQSLQYCRQDLFANEDDYEGRNAKIVRTKSGPAETIDLQPFLDSSFYHFTLNDGYVFFKDYLLKTIFKSLDSIITNTTFNLENLLMSLEKWYSVYRFSQNINDDYTILQLDTTVTIDNITLPIRLEFIGERLADEIIPTALGNLDCKKFLSKIVISYLIKLPPLPTIAVPFLSLEEYTWIAQDYWVIKKLRPSANVDLSIFGLAPFFINGLSTKLDGVTSTENENPITNDFNLYHNYPNPFNPSTMINYQLPDQGYVSLIVYDLLGREIATLVNEVKPSGYYEVEFNASALPSGVYMYRLQVGSFVETRKMVLLK